MKLDNLIEWIQNHPIVSIIVGILFLIIVNFIRTIIKEVKEDERLKKQNSENFKNAFFYPHQSVEVVDSQENELIILQDEAEQPEQPKTQLKKVVVKKQVEQPKTQKKTVKTETIDSELEQIFLIVEETRKKEAATKKTTKPVEKPKLSENEPVVKMPTVKPKLSVNDAFNDSRNVVKEPTVKPKLSQNEPVVKVPVLESIPSPNKSDNITEKPPTEIIKSPTEELKREVKYIGYKPSLIFSQKQNISTYPFVSMPKPQSVIKFPRKLAEGRIGVRGIKEVDFDDKIRGYFRDYLGLQFYNDRFLFISANTRPYEPDHVLIDERNNLNLFIDIEIDEPYDMSSRLATHEQGKDNYRNSYFNDRGWIVIRFAEIQVHENILGCCKHIAEVIKSVFPNFEIPNDLLEAKKLTPITIWTKLEADNWAKNSYREEYLGIKKIERRINKLTTKIAIEETEQDKKAEDKVQNEPLEIEVETLDINIRNAHPRDSQLKFNKEQHRYWINNNADTISGTTFIHKFFPDFDALRIAPFVAKKRGIKTEDVLLEWENERQDSADLGTQLHSDIEMYFKNKTINDKVEFQQFLNLFEKIKELELYRTEWRIFDDELMLAGTADSIFRKRDGTFVIYDWKRSKEIKLKGHVDSLKKTTQKGLGICSDLEDCNHQHYCLQLNLYKKILEKHYFQKGAISEMYFVQLHSNRTSYQLFEVPNMQDKISAMLDEL